MAGDLARAAMLTALVAGPGATAAPAAGPRTDAVAIVLPEGRCELRAASPDAMAALNLRLEQARQGAAGLAQRLAADAAAARFAGAREAVPAFGAWAYDWVQSYITAYRIAGRMLASIAAAARGEVPSVTDGLVEQMAEPMRRAFEERVLARAAPPAGLRADLEMAAVLVEAAWSEALHEALAPLRAGPDAKDGAELPRLDLARAARVPALELRAGGQGAGAPGSDPASLFFHSMRPIAARVSAVMLRATEAGSVVAAVGALGYRLGGMPGLAAGTVGGVGVYWGIDFALNRADAALNREDFEAQALEVIGRSETAIAEAARRQVLEALDARVALLSGRGGCAGAAAP